jgi:hypothetical protein
MVYIFVAAYDHHEITGAERTLDGELLRAVTGLPDMLPYLWELRATW